MHVILALYALMMLASVLALGAVSLDPSTFAEGGLMDDFDATITEATFCFYDYNGTVPEGALSLGLSLTDEDGKVHNQYWSAGDKKYFSPGEGTTVNPDGVGPELVPIADKANLAGGSNAGKFFEALINCGFPLELIGPGNVGVLVGTKLHWNRVAAPKRGGLVRTGKNAEREQTILLPSVLISLPGQAAAKPKTALGKPAVAGVGGVKPATAPVKMATKPATAPATAKPATPATNGNADLDALLTVKLIEALGAAGGVIPKTKLNPAMLAALSDQPAAIKGKGIARAFSEAFLSTGGDGAWVYDGENISLAA